MGGGPDPLRVRGNDWRNLELQGEEEWKEGRKEGRKGGRKGGREEGRMDEKGRMDGG